ncbi:MAG: hypothetical protein VR66_07945 [Peptococcaceae bacterium BRH_c23]|nr:MAG: hypothetical protein VR66_07945 [Peptococcaceae bacterium BRH_c23]KJS78575.1 MAG: hypothetical protein JL57_31360 [Desulfosporosinus sp. BICA1-9]HBW36793.1 hypothetical protein [Desulfosporosinus sp.]
MATTNLNGNIFIRYAVRWIGDNAGHLADGTFFDQISLSPFNIANIVVLLVIGFLALLSSLDKSKKTPKEKK